MAAHHRLGLSGNFMLPPEHVENARLFGLSIRKERRGYRLSMEGNSEARVKAVLPPGQALKDLYSTSDVKQILSFLYRPLAGLTASQPHPEQARQSLHDVIRFMARGSVDPLPEDKAGKDQAAHHNHSDGCEIVADDMLEEAASRSDGEVFGSLLRGFTYSPVSGAFTLALSSELAHPSLKKGARGKLSAAISQSLNKATNYRYAMKHTHSISLDAAELAAFIGLVLEHLEKTPGLIADVRAEEKQQVLDTALARKKEAIEASSSYAALTRLKPDHVVSVEQRLIGLQSAAQILSGLIDNPEMRSIWRKFKFTERNNPKGIEEFVSRLADLQAASAALLQNGAIGLEESEALSAEFRDVIAAGRYFISILDQSIDKAAGRSPELEEQRGHLKLLDSLFENASIVPISLAPDYLESDIWDVSHYLARHTGVEGIHYGRAFKDFIDDFGGEVIEFVQKNPALTALSVVALYMMITNNGGGNQAINLAPEYAGVSSAIDPLTGLPIPSSAPPATDVAVKVCHWHTPPQIKAVVPEELLRALKLEHCLVSNQWANQLQDAYSLMKGPLSMILAAPDQAADVVTSLRGADAPPFGFAESFHHSAKFFGDFYFVANGYQNLAHAPWFGVAFAMGWKLGLWESMKKTSGLINPLVDALAATARTNPAILPVAIAAAAYGYSQQGLSGAIAGTVMGSFVGWGAQSAADFLQKIPELEMLRKQGVLQSVTPSYRAMTRAQDLIDQGCPEALAQTIETLIKAAVEPASAAGIFPAERTRDLPLDVGGVRINPSLNVQTHTELLKGLHGFSCLLETMPEKAGFGAEDNAYKTHLQDSLRRMISVLEDYAEDKDLAGSGLEKSLPAILGREMETVIGAELKHFGVSHVYEALQAGPLSEKQKLRITARANRLERYLTRGEGHGVDKRTLLHLCKTMGQSLKNIARQPLLVPLSLAYKTALMGKAALTMSLREAWYGTQQTLSHALDRWQRIGPKTKGNIIGGGLFVAALSTGVDFSPAAHEALSAYPVLVDAAHQISSASGHAAGATTATGLFGVYNFAEDHLLIHVGLGFLFIGAAAGMKLVARPVVKLGKTVLTPTLDAAEDIGLPARAPGHAFNRAVKELKNYGQKIVQYDELYLKEPSPAQG
ncbi:MAG: hypothetical protein LRY54_04540 [Alphaproteobacteria bacterium]|nr:hypothetical protein [Alphaproteobacteria bacterium]